MEIGKRLRELREAKGWSQGHIEKRTGLFRGYISRIECGHAPPNLVTLEKWAKALDLEMYQLFYEGRDQPVDAKVSEARALNRKEMILLDLFRRMPERERCLFLGLGRVAVKKWGK